MLVSGFATVLGDDDDDDELEHDDELEAA